MAAEPLNREKDAHRRWQLTPSDRRVDLIAVFRVGPLADSGLIARSLRSQEFILCAAPAYLDTHGAPKTPADLLSQECLGFAYGITRDQWCFSGPKGTETVEVSFRLLINNGQSLLTAALAGLGILLQPTPLVRDAVKAGRLVRLLPDYVPLSRPMHILYAPDRRITPKLRSFIDFAAARFG